ncbi:sulfatase-like hydrolase/transferase [Enterobacteriaceae bacterium H4N4]|uniref:Sulfatase-like hydrolase/transferase n=1 Tax=Silvania confinis TaxID=2926470 RepID=A0A9J6QLE5_9ENTR|nr:sulfatase-like hydrolase/transferase [Silvania confinis]MCU6670150.1 sulfatase-like hydrolase/transferase [Silvania confinis]
MKLKNPLFFSFCFALPFAAMLAYVGRLDLLSSFVIEFVFLCFANNFIRSDIVRRILWGAYFIILGVQAASLFSSGQYLMPLALSNSAEFGSLGISAFIKIIGVFVLFVLFSQVMVCRGRPTKSRYVNIVVVISALALSCVVQGPIQSLYNTFKFYYLQVTFTPNAKVGDEGKLFLKTHFYNDPIDRKMSFKDYNVIVIFTEGISSEVIGKTNGRTFSITPNLDRLTHEGINVTNYYNHTAATFRGLRGQLTSGYQYRDGVTNEGTGINQLSTNEINNIYLQRQITLPEILTKSGYHNYFIASTEKNSALNTMLKTLKFDQVLGMGNFVGYQHDRMTDKQTFNALRDFLRGKEKNNERFFVGVYPSGTHHGQDSPNEKFADGTNALYNKFYNFDFQLGKFVESFKNSALYDNTLLIITADHATFPSTDYKKSFNSNAQFFVNDMPLIIIGKDVKPQVINAHAQNSLSLAPTLLHMLGIQYSMNYFLGCSLFDVSCKSPFSHSTAIGDDFFITNEDGTVTLLPYNDSSETKRLIRQFYNISG